MKEKRIVKRKLVSTMLVLALFAAIIPSVSTPAMAVGDSSAAVSAGEDHTMIIKSDGSLWTCGNNMYGQIGDGTVTKYENYQRSEDNTRYAPVKIMDGVASVSAGWTHSMAVKTDGSLWAWGGRNVFGKLGDGTKIDRYSPVKIMDSVASVSAGESHTMAVKTDGSLWAWGYNHLGELGDGTFTERYSPVKIMDGVASVTVGYSHTLAIKTDGSLWAWGVNDHGCLGDGTNITRYTPVKIMDGVASVSAGESHSMAVKTDGSLWVWGFNDEYGQVGDGTKVSSYSPVKIMDGVASVSAGESHSMAVKTDGSLWGWGGNSYGQLGDGTLMRQYSPVKIMDGVASVSAGRSYTVAVKTDGSLWGCGHNGMGQLGAGTDIDSSYTFIKIMDGVRRQSSVAPTLPPKPANATAAPTASKVLVNGSYVAFDAYNIGGNNYFKLRDLAYVLSGTLKQFEVGWDGAKNAISLTSGEPYTPVGGEMTGKGAGNKTAIPTSSKIYLDGNEVSFTAYNIGGNNYFKLRDIGEAFDFGVDWDGVNKTIVIDTSKVYTPE